jgi:hypothetical protein
VDFRTTVAHTFAFLFAAARSHVRVQFVARCSGRRLICLVCARSRYTQLAPEEIVQRFGKIVTFGVYRRDRYRWNKIVWSTRYFYKIYEWS